MDDFTRKFNVVKEKDDEIRHILTTVYAALEDKGYSFLSADIAQIPSTTTALTDADQMVSMGKLLDALEDNDDVQNVWHNLENEDDLDR